jgi:hypothetical protein
VKGRENDFEFQPSFVIVPISYPSLEQTSFELRHSSFHLPIPHPLYKHHSRCFAQIRCFEKRGRGGDENKKVKKMKKAPQKNHPSVASVPPC